jgi:hypothetical protein
MLEPPVRHADMLNSVGRDIYFPERIDASPFGQVNFIPTYAVGAEKKHCNQKDKFCHVRFHDKLTHPLTPSAYILCR